MNFMEKITINLPEDLEFMKDIPAEEWSFIVTKMLQSKLEEIRRFEQISSKSKANEKDVEELASKINNSLSERYK